MKNFFKVSALACALAFASAAFAEGEVVIYTNSDEEAQVAMREALDANGFEGKYLLQSFGTSELGGRLMAEGKNIEADIITLSTYYLDSVQAKDKIFADLTFDHEAIDGNTVSFYAPILGNTGAMFINTEVLADDGLEAPKSLKDLADPKYEGHISVPDITGSSTSWLMTQALIDAYGEAEGVKLVQAIEKNAGDHLEMSGSAPLKKIRAGEVAVGFGLRHQAVADKKQGLPIELTKNTFAYFREGWDYPDAVALLYALYLYAEHTGRKTFTFTELANAHANPEAQGISPHDIYGIDVKDFREKVQGLAMTYPQYIRVSFVANLDNIILEDYTSIDILDLAENE